MNAGPSGRTGKQEEVAHPQLHENPEILVTKSAYLGFSIRLISELNLCKQWSPPLSMECGGFWFLAARALLEGDGTHSLPPPPHQGFPENSWVWSLGASLQFVGLFRAIFMHLWVMVGG